MKKQSRSINQKVNKLIEKMTIKEKVHQLASNFPNGNERLGIPNLQAGECLHGVLADEATSFPQAIALGSTWDPDLIERVSSVIAREARALGIHQCFSPMLGLARDCRWGRTEESFGEDPFHVSQIGAAFIRGLQGMGDERFGPDKVIATAKHFVGDGEPVSGINGAAVEISERTLHEMHLYPFKVAVLEAGVYSIMPAHHSINGIPCHTNEDLIKNVLRKEYGFDGFLVSDNGDIRKLHSTLKTARSVNEAAVQSLKAGVDSELAWMIPWGSNRAYGSEFVQAIENGEIEENIVNEAVSNILNAKFALGLFDQVDSFDTDADLLDFHEQNSGDEHIHYADTKRSFGIKRENWKEILYAEEHNKIARLTALKSIILLKNEQKLLPLDKDNIQKIAVLGPNSNSPLLGGYSTLNPRYVSTVLDGITKIAGDCEILHAEGCSPVDFEKTDIDAAVKCACEADIAIVVIGGNELTCKENEDIDSLELSGDQQEFLEAVYNTGTKVVLILMHGRPNSIVWAKEKIPSILECWYLGQECGNAIAETIFGEANPGGKLPITIPRNAGQCPAYYNKLPSGRIGRYYNSDPEPLFPFGYGLSYTDFELSIPRLSSSVMKDSETITVFVTIENKGKYDGEEVVQLYVQSRYSPLTRPILELKDFKRIFLKTGESKEVQLEIDKIKLSYRDRGQWKTEKGIYNILTGPDSVHLQSAELEYIG